MHIDLISLIAGMILVSILWASVAGAKGEPPKDNEEYVNHMTKLAVAFPELIGCMVDRLAESKAILAEIRDLVASPPEPARPLDTYWEEVLTKALEPHKDALFRIAADTELSKKKFDVLAKLIGLDDKAAYANHMDRNEDEDNDLVFNEMVVQEMKDQGLNWSQAVDTVKSRMAHRSRVR